MKLFIAEKPSLAQAIAAGIGVGKDSGRNRRREKIRRLHQSKWRERDSDVVLRAHSRTVESGRIRGKVSGMANGRLTDNTERVEVESKVRGGKAIQNSP